MTSKSTNSDNGSEATPARACRFLVIVSVLITVAFAGATNLPQPFDGDQSLFAMGAEQWFSGQVYFRDFWDLKPPGIYLFCMAGGAMFGFDEIGIHLFELLWSMTLAGLLVLVVAKWFRSELASVAAPLMTVGVYHCIADTWHLTQIEWIVALPLSVSVWCMCPFPAKRIPSTSAFLVAGICGGIVGLFKPMYGLLPAAFWLCSVLMNPADSLRSRLFSATGRGAIFAVGVSLPLGAAAYYFHSHEVLDVALRTMFEYPPKVLAQKNDGYGMLLQGLKWFALVAGPMTALAIVGSTLVVRGRRDSFGVGLVVWLVLGLVLIFAQRMWWEYHYLLVLMPLGLLALKAIDTLVYELEELLPAARVRSTRILPACCGVMLFSAYPAMLLYRTALLSTYGFAINPERRLEYQSLQHSEYRTAIAETQFLNDPASRAGDIYVFGNPIAYHFARRHQAIPQQGWSIKVYLPEQWTDIEQRLRTAQPVYVFVATNKHEQLMQRRRSVLNLLADSYHIIRESPNGTWHELTNDRTDVVQTAQVQ